MKVSLILEAIDRATRPARAVTQAMRDIADRGMKPLAAAAAETSIVAERGFGRVRAAARNLASQGLNPVTAAYARVRAAAGAAKHATLDAFDAARDRVTRNGTRFQKGWTLDALDAGRDFVTGNGTRFRGLAAALESAGRAFGSVNRVARDQPDLLDNLGRGLGRLISGPTGLKSMASAATAAAEKLRAPLRLAGIIPARWAGLAALGVGGATVGIAGSLVAGVIRKGSEFEQYQVQLETTLGSAQKAKEAMAFIKTFAQRTPYEVDEVTKAFVTAKAQGIDPFHGAMDAIGDAAGGMGKSFVDTVIAVGEAGHNQYRRLLNLGIVAHSKGGKVALSYIDKSGKEITRSVKKTTLAVQGAVLDIFRERNGGGMARQAQTIAGIWGNLKDTLTNFQVDVAQGGFLEAIKSKMQGLLNWLNAKSKDGSLARWAKQTSDFLTTLFEKAIALAKSINWSEVGSTLLAVAKGVWAIATAFAKLVNLTVQLRQAAGDLGGAAAPGKKPQMPGGNSIIALPGQLLSGAMNRGLRGVIDYSDMLAGRHSKQAFTPQLGPPHPLPGARQPAAVAAPAPTTRQKVSLEINLKGDGARRASVQRISADGGDVDASIMRGRAMAAFA